MGTALWVITVLLAIAFTIGGATQILMPQQRYREIGPSQQWADDFQPGHLRAIGTIKLVGVVGLLLPPLLGVAQVLTPLAACGLMLLMSGAATTRFRRCEWGYMAGDVVFLAAFAFVAWGRFDLAPFGG